MFELWGHNALLRGKRLKPPNSKQNNNSPKLQNSNRNPESACPLLKQLVSFCLFHWLKY